jgi:hypothetical protein
LFERERIERMSGHLRQLLQSAVQAPDTRLHAIEIFSPEERERLALSEKDWEVINTRKLNRLKRKAVSFAVHPMSGRDTTS